MAFQDFIIALAKALGIVLIVGLLTLIIGRALWIRWSRRWQYVIRYNLFRSKVDPIKAEWCMEAVRRGLKYDKIKMMLYLRGFKDQDVHEMMFLCTQFSNQLKGGKNGREQFKRSDKKDERNFPDISSY
jgi:hypothetical protein